MDSDLIRAAFAIYVVGVAMIRLLSDEDYDHIAVMKRIWGHSVGLLLIFVTDIAIPALFALVYLCRGIVTLNVT
jgi:hypothetical protein